MMLLQLLMMMMINIAERSHIIISPNYYASCPQIGEKLFERVAEWHVETIIMTYCKMTDTSLLALARGIASNTHITSLYLMGNRFTSKGVVAFGQALKENRALAMLDLTDNRFDLTRFNWS